MKKTGIIVLIFAMLFLISACSSKKSSSQQVLMSNVETAGVSPSPSPTVTPSAEPTQPSSPKAEVKAPTVTTQPSQVPAKTNTPVPPTPTAQPETPAPSVTAGPLVFIDAGHGGNDPGASGNGLIEKNVTLDIAKRLNDTLIKNNIKTYMVRTNDTFMDHRDRIYLANDMKASLYISIHCDWFDNPKYSGTQTFYTTAKELKLGDLTELQYAKTVQNEIISAIKSNNRGISDRPTLAAVKYATMPSILIETGFLSNPSEAANLATGEYRQKIADSMASGIIQCLAKANLK